MMYEKEAVQYQVSLGGAGEMYGGPSDGLFPPGLGGSTSGSHTTGGCTNAITCTDITAQHADGCVLRGFLFTGMGATLVPMARVPPFTEEQARATMEAYNIHQQQMAATHATSVGIPTEAPTPPRPTVVHFPVPQPIVTTPSVSTAANNPYRISKKTADASSSRVLLLMSCSGNTTTFTNDDVHMSLCFLLRQLEIDADKIYMVNQRSPTGPYVASVHTDAAEALLEDTVDISQVKGDGQNEFHIQRLDSNGRTMASAEKYVKRAAERQAARADHARPKSYLRAFIDLLSGARCNASRT